MESSSCSSKPILGLDRKKLYLFLRGTRCLHRRGIKKSRRNKEKICTSVLLSKKISASFSAFSARTTCPFCHFVYFQEQNDTNLQNDKIVFFIDFHRISLMFILSFCLKKDTTHRAKAAHPFKWYSRSATEGIKTHRNKENLSFCHQATYLRNVQLSTPSLRKLLFSRLPALLTLLSLFIHCQKFLQMI